METFILVILSNGDVYRQVKRSGALIALGQVGRLYAGLAVDNPIFNSVGASRYRIYCIFLSGSQEGLPNLDGGTLRSKAGTGKGTEILVALDWAKDCKWYHMQVETASQANEIEI
jgi:hypothetical protein